MTPMLAAQIAARLTGFVQIVLGLLVWTGHAESLVTVHIAVGLLLSLDLLVAAGLGLRAGARPGLWMLALAWSAGMPVFGLTQAGLLPGSAHVVAQVIHLLAGLAAIGLVEALAASSRHRTEPART